MTESLEQRFLDTTARANRGDRQAIMDLPEIADAYLGASSREYAAAYNRRAAIVTPEEQRVLSKYSLTDRGFARLEFRDYNGMPCSVQKSSLAEVDCVWVGVDKQRMHLTQEQGGDLAKVLKRFAKTGELS